jgi:hypothetical protein
MTEHEPPSLIPLPFPLPLAFAERLRYQWDRRLVGVHTEGGRCTITDGVNTLDGGSYAVLEELLYQPGVLPWLDERQIDLGSDYRPASHWLIVDRKENHAYLSRAIAARDKVRTQRLEE